MFHRLINITYLSPTLLAQNSFLQLKITELPHPLFHSSGILKYLPSVLVICGLP